VKAVMKEMTNWCVFEMRCDESDGETDDQQVGEKKQEVDS